MNIFLLLATLITFGIQNRENSKSRTYFIWFMCVAVLVAGYRPLFLSVIGYHQQHGPHSNKHMLLVTHQYSLICGTFESEYEWYKSVGFHQIRSHTNCVTLYFDVIQLGGSELFRLTAFSKSMQHSFGHSQVVAKIRKLAHIYTVITCTLKQSN